MPAMNQEVDMAMRIRGFRYFMTEAFKNIFSNGWMSLASVFTVMASLLILGVFLILSINLNSVVGGLEDDYEIIVVMDEKTTEEGIPAIKKEILKVENVADATLDRNSDRLEKLKEKFGENGSLLDRYKDDNPLRNWYRITLNDLTRTSETVEKLEKINGVEKVIQNEDAISNLVRIANYIRSFSVWIIAALAIVSVFIISNTIKLTVYTRRKEINIMKFVGATDWFIRWPFIIEGIIIGVIGACASVALVLVGYNFLVNVVQNNIMFVTLKPLNELLSLILGSTFGLGVVLGGLGSFIAVRKHLNV